MFDCLAAYTIANIFFSIGNGDAYYSYYISVKIQLNLFSTEIVYKENNYAVKSRGNDKEICR